MRLVFYKNPARSRFLVLFIAAASYSGQCEALHLQDNAIDRSTQSQHQLLPSSSSLAQLESQSWASAEAGTEFANKVARFARLAWRKLRPAVQAAHQLAGPNTEQFLGMTSLGNYLGIGG